MITAKQASLSAKKYFEEVKGVSVIGFDIESVELKNGIWEVRCSFYPNLVEAKKVFYELRVATENGEVKEAKRVENV